MTENRYKTMLENYRKEETQFYYMTLLENILLSMFTYDNLPNGYVSYTHIRAHETVLDLVCRILLEKKTKSQNNKSNTTIYMRNKNT